MNLDINDPLITDKLQKMYDRAIEPLKEMHLTVDANGDTILANGVGGIEIKNVSHWFGEKRVLNKVNLTIPFGQIVSLVGPSGCGKSTLLQAILGTHPAKAGCIFVNKKEVVRPCRDVGIVYQDYKLYDFFTAQENVAFGPMLDRTTPFYRWFGWTAGWFGLRKKFLAEAMEMLKTVGLEKSATSYPEQLSGGMRQRVAIAQSLIMAPKLLLLDEPFGALDEATREDLQDMIVSLYNINQEAKRNNLPPPYTIILVTHELNEAIYLADRVVGLSQYHSDGKLGATVVYDEPATAFDRNSERDYGLFVHQKDDLRRIVFPPKN